MPTAPRPHPNPAKPVTYRIGTLSYQRAGLIALFFWLLLGDVVFVLMDQAVPKILPVVLKGHGATDSEIAIVITTIAYLLSVVICPVVSYRSDRKRSPWGRRIPYLFWATPFVVVFLAATPFAPEITSALERWPLARTWLAHLGVSSPVILVYGVLIVLFQLFHMVVASIYFYLFRDVVPEQFLGRFLALFRVFGAVATFILNYWLLGQAMTHTRAIFIGISVTYGLGFLAMCYFVREGTYPAVASRFDAAPHAGPRWLHAARTFVAESYRSPLYWWTYLTRMMIYAMFPVQAFLVFFPQRELGLTLDQVGKLSAWGAFVWFPLAVPLGWALDRWGPLRILSLCLIANAVALAGSFFFVTGETSFFVSSLCLGIFFPGGVLMLSQLVLAQRIFHPQRMGQLSAANAMVQALVLALVVGPGTGWLLDALHHVNFQMQVPLAGAVAVGPYRFVYVISLVLTLVSLVCTHMAEREWLKLGGDQGYQPPL